MDFKEWLLQEVGTSTANVAGFSRISIPLIRRKWANKIVFPDPWEDEDEFFKRDRVQKVDTKRT